MERLRRTVVQLEEAKRFILDGEVARVPGSSRDRPLLEYPSEDVHGSGPVSTTARDR
jgi:hypothetical protein